MCEDAMEFSDSFGRPPTQQNLKIAEHVAAYNACDMHKVARIDEHDEERRVWKTYILSTRKYRTGVS